MKIKKFKYENKNLDLKINPINFSNLSLLVGGSGVGKTLILQAILDLKKISKGKSLGGVDWEIQFSIGKEEANYLWKGAFERTEVNEIENDFYDDDDDGTMLARPKIIYEELYFKDQLIVERKENEIKLNGKSTPKLSSYKSVLNLFNEEEIISLVYKNFNKIIGMDNSDTREIQMFENFDKLLEKYTTIENLHNADIPIYLKLAIAYKNKMEVFDTVKRNFINVFTQVEDIKLDLLPKEDLPVFIGNMPRLQFKEKNVSKWIFQDKISSGMRKTLMQISQLFLCAESTVILIDEFENSLGINCIDTLTEKLLDDSIDLQFILTSHHPYIINAIGMKHLKIVSRNGGVISTKNAEEYKLGKSRHEAFKQLIQLNDYRKWIMI
jgi:GTPase SAR1 family protein